MNVNYSFWWKIEIICEIFIEFGLLYSRILRVIVFRRNLRVEKLIM